MFSGGFPCCARAALNASVKFRRQGFTPSQYVPEGFLFQNRPISPVRLEQIHTSRRPVPCIGLDTMTANSSTSAMRWGAEEGEEPWFRLLNLVHRLSRMEGGYSLEQS